MSPGIRVLIVDDHSIVTQGLVHVLNQTPGTAVVGVAGTAREALEQIERLRPDVVLLDQVLPDGRGLDVVPAIRGGHPHTAVVLLSGALDDSMAAQAQDAGCAAALSKAATVDDIIGAVVAAAATVDVVVGRPSRSVRFGLTPREIEVLRCIARGLSSKEMSVELHLAPDTARNYTQNVLNRLGAHSKAEAAAIATRDGLLVI